MEKLIQVEEKASDLLRCGTLGPYSELVQRVRVCGRLLLGPWEA